MTLEQCYNTFGGDYKEVLGRMGNSERIVRKFALKFPNDPTAPALFEAFEQNDMQTAFRMAHTLKGIALNLGFIKLFKSSSELTEALRNEVKPEAPALCEEVKADYQTIIKTLEAADPE